MSIKTFGELQDGDIFELAQAQGYGSSKRYIKCLEMGEPGNCVEFDNSRRVMMVPADVKVVPSPSNELELNQQTFKTGTV